MGVKMNKFILKNFWLIASLLLTAGCGTPEREETEPLSELEVEEIRDVSDVADNVGSNEDKDIVTGAPSPAIREAGGTSNEWKQDLPENHGIESKWLEEFNKKLQDKQIHAALLVRDGTIVYEYYSEGYNKDSRFDLYSCTKSITSAAVGIAIEQGYLPGVDSQIGDFFPAVTDDQMKEVTVEQLLNLSSGIDWTENTSGEVFLDWLMAENQVDFILQKNMKSAPGEVFNYSSGNSHLISAILTQVTGMPEAEYVRKNLFEPIGIQDFAWWSDTQGITIGGFGIWMTARDAARFGQLYLKEGKWGERQIVPAQWVRISTSSHGPNKAYGYNWWIDTPKEQQKYSMYYAEGYGGQYIFVVPELQIVTVVMSRGVEDFSIITAFKELLDELE